MLLDFDVYDILLLSTLFDTGVSSSILSYFILISLFMTQILHVENGVQNGVLHVKKEVQNGSQNGLKINIHFQNELAFPHCLEAWRLQG